MTPLQEKIWNLVHNWCDNQENGANIPDQSRRYLMDLIMAEIPYDWKPYPANKPDKYGKYLIMRKDGKIHWETWNNLNWAYNSDVITHFCVINKPIKE